MSGCVRGGRKLTQSPDHRGTLRSSVVLRWSKHLRKGNMSLENLAFVDAKTMAVLVWRCHAKSHSLFWALIIAVITFLVNVKDSSVVYHIKGAQCTLSQTSNRNLICKYAEYTFYSIYGKKKKKKSGNLKICFYVVASKLSVFKSKYYFKWLNQLDFVLLHLTHFKGSDQVEIDL